MIAFAAGSAITATSGLWSFAGLPWLVAGRVLQGLGGGGLVPLSLALAADLYREGARTLLLLARYGKEEKPERVLPRVSQDVLAEMASWSDAAYAFRPREDDAPPPVNFSVKHLILELCRRSDAALRSRTSGKLPQ